MGERDWYRRYITAREYADDQAEKLRRGEEIKGWAYEHDWKQGEPEPPKLSLNGAAWVARAYAVAADSALSLIQAEGKGWQGCYDECQRLTTMYQDGEQGN